MSYEGKYYVDRCISTHWISHGRFVHMYELVMTDKLEAVRWLPFSSHQKSPDNFIVQYVHDNSMLP